MTEMPKIMKRFVQQFMALANVHVWQNGSFLFVDQDILIDDNSFINQD